MPSSHFLTKDQKEILMKVAQILSARREEIQRTWTVDERSIPNSTENQILFQLRRSHLKNFVEHIRAGDFDAWESSILHAFVSLRHERLDLIFGSSLHFCTSASCLEHLVEEFKTKPKVQPILLALECFHQVCLAMVLNGSNPANSRTKTGRHPVRLTKRENEVLDLVMDGLNSKAVALRLLIAVKTVEAHRANIMKKVGVKSTVQLVRYAYQEKGLL